MKNTVFAACFFLVSCQSADHISRFSGTALDAVKGIDQQPVQFAYCCAHFAEIPLRALTDTTLYSAGKTGRADCSQYKRADSILHVVSGTIQLYLSSLQSVADPKLIAFKARVLTNAFDGLSPSLFPALSFTDDKKAAVRDILETVLNEPLKAIRLKKLMRVIRASDSAFGKVLSAYEYMLSPALSGEIEQGMENYKSFVYTRVYGWSRTLVEKIQANAMYRIFQEERSAELSGIKKEMKILETIRLGHHSLATQPTKAGFKDVEAEISKDILLIDGLIGDIQALRD